MVQLVTTSGPTNDNERQRMTMSRYFLIFCFFRRKEELNHSENLEGDLLKLEQKQEKNLKNYEDSMT